jgi:hypothetical protein
MNELEETAKATQEVAKTTNTAIETIRDFGNYMSKFLTPPLEQVSELITDKLKYYTVTNQLNLMKKAQEKMDELGLSPQNTIPLKLGIPLLEAASLEDDDKLQELWANLLVNSSTSFSLERSYISVLEQLSPLEAKILIQIYNQINLNIDDIGSIDITNYPKIKVTKKISEYYTGEENIEKENKFEKDKIEYSNEPNIDTTELNLALSNLIRLNCLLRVITFGGGENFNNVHPTLFGAKLYAAVKEPTN